MNPIAAHRWESRVLVFSASSPNSVGYRRQEQLLNRSKKGIKERDLIIYRLYDDHWLDHNNNVLSNHQALAIRKAYQIPEGKFQVILIGKDGTVKMRKEDIVSTREIFSLIDSMPMRKSEMRRSTSSSKEG